MDRELKNDVAQKWQEFLDAAKKLKKKAKVSTYVCEDIDKCCREVYALNFSTSLRFEERS